MTPSRILVTGGAGFIGSHLVERLLSDGHHVRVLDDLSTGKRENLPSHPRLELRVGDVADAAAATAATEDRDVVFHLAAVASVQASIDDPLATHRTNLEGTIRLLEAAKAAGVRRFVYASSAAVYGDAPEGPVGEDAPKRPLSPYAADKLAGEHYLAHYHRQGWLHGSAFRFFNVYGPRQDPSSPYSGVISIFARRAARSEPVTIFGDGRQTRDFVFVRDLVEVLVASLAWERPEELAPTNVGRGTSVSLLDLLDAIESVVGRPVTRTSAAARAGDIRHSLADVRRLRSRLPDLRFASLADGLAATIGDGVHG